jgi:hypothetical protein
MVKQRQGGPKAAVIVMSSPNAALRAPASLKPKKRLKKQLSSPGSASQRAGGADEGMARAGASLGGSRDREKAAAAEADEGGEEDELDAELRRMMRQGLIDEDDLLPKKVRKAKLRKQMKFKDPQQYWDSLGDWKMLDTGDDVLIGAEEGGFAGLEILENPVLLDDSMFTPGGECCIHACMHVVAARMAHPWQACAPFLTRPLALSVEGGLDNQAEGGKRKTKKEARMEAKRKAAAASAEVRTNNLRWS